MGTYLNSGNNMFIRARKSEIYVDKSGILTYLNSVLYTEKEYVCISRPRRFGKSITANMISAFYDRTCNAEEDFRGLEILEDKDFRKYANQYNVIHINIQDFLSEAETVEELIGNLKADLMDELQMEFPDVRMPARVTLPKVMSAIFSQTEVPFVVVIDEWDCLFREYRHDLESQRTYLDFLRYWLKDKAYLALAYMTGILPIKKYGSHSALNMFSEFSMEHPDMLASYVGFTEEETKKLCEKYEMDFSECRAWYDGYSFPECQHIYSPKSVVDAMTSHRFGSYWTSTETYEALKRYIDMNEDGLRDAIVKMMGGGRQKINTDTFQNDMVTFHSADDVLTLLVHLGYLGYDIEKEEVFIPNNEIRRQYGSATEKGAEWEIISHSIRRSDQLLEDVWNMEEGKVAEALASAHLETSHLQYNDENALSYTISLAFYSARRYYNIVREMPAGKGFADLVFLPRPQHTEKPALVVELKWDKKAQTAISQIHRKQYGEALQGYAGEILLVGITYDKRNREHQAKIEKLVK